MGFALIPSKPFDYVLEEHRGLPEPRPTFRLRYLGSRLFSELVELVTKEPARAAVVVVSASLVGWTNIERDGEACVFRPADKARTINGIQIEGGAAPECVDALPFPVVMELMQATLNANQLDRETAKN